MSRVGAVCRIPIWSRADRQFFYPTSIFKYTCMQKHVITQDNLYEDEFEYLSTAQSHTLYIEIKINSLHLLSQVNSKQINLSLGAAIKFLTLLITDSQGCEFLKAKKTFICLFCFLCSQELVSNTITHQIENPFQKLCISIKKDNYNFCLMYLINFSGSTR